MNITYNLGVFIISTSGLGFITPLTLDPLSIGLGLIITTPHLKTNFLESRQTAILSHFPN